MYCLPCLPGKSAWIGAGAVTAPMGRLSSHSDVRCFQRTWVHLPSEAEWMLDVFVCYTAVALMVMVKRAEWSIM